MQTRNGPSSRSPSPDLIPSYACSVPSEEEEEAIEPSFLENRPSARPIQSSYHADGPDSPTISFDNDHTSFDYPVGSPVAHSYSYLGGAGRSGDSSLQNSWTWDKRRRDSLQDVLGSLRGLSPSGSRTAGGASAFDALRDAIGQMHEKSQDEAEEVYVLAFGLVQAQTDSVLLAESRTLASTTICWLVSLS